MTFLLTKIFSKFLANSKKIQSILITTTNEGRVLFTMKGNPNYLGPAFLEFLNQHPEIYTFFEQSMAVWKQEQQQKNAKNTTSQATGKQSKVSRKANTGRARSTKTRAVKNAKSVK